MNSSFSLRRFGVISRISSARCAVCVRRVEASRSWSLNGSSSRCCSMSALTSSPSSGTGKAGERSGHRVARRERRGVVVHRDRFVVPGDHHDVVMRFALHRALRPQVLEVRIRIGDGFGVAEEVDRVEVGHRSHSKRTLYLGRLHAPSPRVAALSSLQLDERRDPACREELAPEVDDERRRPNRTARRAASSASGSGGTGGRW